MGAPVPRRDHLGTRRQCTANLRRNVEPSLVSPPPSSHRSPRLSRRHDQSYKLLFSLPLAIHHLIRGFINSDLADELDFERMENLATERTTSGLVRSQADLIWKIHFRGSSRYLLLPMEFQSRTDRYMAARMLYYVAVAYHGLLARKTQSLQLAPGGLLPPALATTILQRARPLDSPGRCEGSDRAGARVAGRPPAHADPQGA